MSPYSVSIAESLRLSDLYRIELILSVCPGGWGVLRLGLMLLQVLEEVEMQVCAEEQE